MSAPDVELPAWMDHQRETKQSLTKWAERIMPGTIRRSRRCTVVRGVGLPGLEECRLAAGHKGEHHFSLMRDTAIGDRYDQLADELIDRIGKVEAIDRDHLAGTRLVRDRLSRYLADLHDFDRSGVTG